MVEKRFAAKIRVQKNFEKNFVRKNFEKIKKYFFKQFLIDLISSPQVASSRLCAPRRLLQRLVLGFA